MDVVRLTRSALDLLHERRIFHGRLDERWRPGDLVSVPDNARLEAYSQIFEGQGLPSAMGAFSCSHSPLSRALEVGRYSSIGRGVRVLDHEHATGRATTYPVADAEGPLPAVRSYFSDNDLVLVSRRAPEASDPVVVGNDVRIGDDVQMAPGVRIGDGAVVARGSVVREDVPPYALVEGGPAKVSAMRFETKAIERMIRLRWWRFAPVVMYGKPIESPEAFLESLEAKPPAELVLPVTSGAEILALCEPAFT